MNRVSKAYYKKTEWQAAQNKLSAFLCTNRSNEPSKFACKKMILHTTLLKNHLDNLILSE